MRSIENFYYLLNVGFWSGDGTGAVSSPLVLYCTFVPYAGLVHSWGASFDVLGAGCWNLCRVFSTYPDIDRPTVQLM